MAGYGSQPGERRGGRPIGGKNKLTLEREREIADVVAVMDRPLGKDVLAEVMMEFRKLAQELCSCVEPGGQRTARAVR